MRIIIGIDPGLVKTGWGIITMQGNAVQCVGCGTIRPKTTLPLEQRLAFLHHALQSVIMQHRPTEAAIEETFVSANGASTLKLGQARGALILSLSIAGLDVAEYAATQVKKSIVGAGRAEKNQVGMMVRQLLPTARAQLESAGEDALDALAIALCHAHHSSFAKQIKAG